MNNNSFFQFVESFKGITSIIPIKKIVGSFYQTNLLSKKQNDSAYFALSPKHEKILVDLPCVKQILYKAFLGDEYDIDICNILNKNLLVLQKAHNRISGSNQKNLKISYGGEILKADFSQFWEDFYELDILAYFERIGSLIYIEPPKKKKDGTSIDFHAEIEDYNIHVEIMTLSDIGNDRVRREHYKKLNKIFSKVFNEPLTFNFSPTGYYQFKKEERDRIEAFLVKNRNEILSIIHNNNQYVFDLFVRGAKRHKISSIANNNLEDILETYELGHNLARFQIYVLEGHSGDGISRIDVFKYYNWVNNFEKISDKYAEKKNAFPKNELNFLLINISKTNPLFMCYCKKERDSWKIKEAIKKGQLRPPYHWVVIDSFENRLSKEKFDKNLTGLIFHRYKGLHTNSGHKLKIYQNPNAIIKIPQVLYSVIEA